MTDPESAFRPAIDALERDYADLERQANALLISINVLRQKAGLPPRPSAFSDQITASGPPGGATLKMHSDSFTGKTLGGAVREYLTMRKESGADAPATPREIFDALQAGGFHSNAKDDATGMVILRTMLRKNSTTFAKLKNGKYGLRAWYPNLKVQKETSGAIEANDADFGEHDDDITVDSQVSATSSKGTS